MQPSEEKNKAIEEFEKERQAVKKQLVKKIASFDKALGNAYKSLEKGKTHQEATHIAELIKAHYSLLKKGMGQITLADWKKEDQEICIPLDPALSPKEQLDAQFSKSKKLQRSIAPLQELTRRLTADQEAYKQALIELDAAEDSDSLEAVKETYGFKPREKKHAAKKTPYHVYISQSNREIFVGKNSESNHILTFQVAHGSDLWLHAHSVSGAHVVVRKGPREEIDPDTLQDALQLALFYSKAKRHPNSLHEVTVTERKYVSRKPTSPKGLAFVSKHKIMNACIDSKRIDRLKTTKV